MHQGTQTLVSSQKVEKRRKAGGRFTFLPILHGSRKWIRDCDTLQKIKHYKLLLFNLFKSLEEQKNVKMFYQSYMGVENGLEIVIRYKK